MASDSPQVLLTRITTGTGADSADAEVLQLQLTTDEVTAIDPVLASNVPSIVIPKFQHQTTVEDGSQVPAAAGGRVLAKVDGSSESVAAGDYLKVENASNKFVKWDLNENLALTTDNSEVAAGTVLTNTTDETALFEHAFAADLLEAGDVVEFWAQGLVIDQNSTDTLTIAIRFGATATAVASRTLVITSPAIDVADNDIFVVNGRITVRTAGASGTMVGSGLGQGPDAGSTVALSWADVMASSALDTTVANTISVTGDWSVAHADNQVRADQFSVKVTRPDAPGAIGMQALDEYIRLVRGVSLAAVTTDTEAEVVVINNPLMMGV